MNIAVVEIGHFALLLCLPLAALQSVLAFVAVTRGSLVLAESARALVFCVWILVCIAFAALGYAFATSDFSVSLVASHSNTALPWYYKLSAVWGNHEGSLLLWGLVLSSWSILFSLRSKNLPWETSSRVLAVLGMITLGFLAFIAFTSNPFDRNLLTPPAEGGDLNPLLQDIGLILHPPLLYIGYVGFSVPFAFAIAALLSGKLDAAWCRWVKPWVNSAWVFLTLGIALGSWWAYYELGWGGWWFWDPVENASLMPWLSGTALLHSLSATEKRGVFRNWTVLLAILTFSLSLMGTFLVRSGILVSVHAFAADPTRGLYILGFLTLVVGSSLVLYALRASTIKPLSSFGLVSRETGLLVNNLLLSVSLLVVLTGTLFPLVAAALEWGSYSVGPPYFNALFVPLSLLMLLVLGFIPFIQWKSTARLVRQRLSWVFVGGLALLAGFALTAWNASLYQQSFEFYIAVVASLCCWVLFMSLWHPVSKSDSLSAIARHSRAYWGMITAHCGVAIMALGVLLTSNYSQQHDVRMQAGDQAMIGPWQFTLQSLDDVDGPNYSATRASIVVDRETREIARLQPEKRRYHANQSVMTEAGIAWSLSRDLYVSLGEPLGDNSWSVRLYIKAYVRLIWLGSLLMAIGGALAMIDKRYQRRVRQATAEVAREQLA